MQTFLVRPLIYGIIDMRRLTCAILASVGPRPNKLRPMLKENVSVF